MNNIEQSKLFDILQKEGAINHFEKIKIGSPSIKILEAIKDSYPKAKQFFYIKYPANFELEMNYPQEKIESCVIPRNFISDIKLRQIAKDIFNHDNGKIMAITSRAIMEDGSEVHIPMMDFNCKKTPQNLSKIEKSMKPYKGFILNSGQCWHWWGSELMACKNFFNFLSNCEEENSKIFDERYILVCQQVYFAALRIFEHPAKPFEPKVIKILK